MKNSTFCLFFFLFYDIIDLDLKGGGFLNDKTEFLFESDAEKAIINNAIKEEENKRKKSYKKIIFNSLVIAFVISSFTLSTNFIANNKVKKLTASVNKLNQENNVEIMNNSSNSLEHHDSSDNKYEILINKANPIDDVKLKNYEIVNVKNNSFKNIKLEKETYENYLKLKENLLNKNYYINIRSGYRTLKESEEIFNEYKNVKGLDYANKYVAKAGTSEHNTGLSMDIVISTNSKSITNNYDSDEYFYLENIAYLYGFIIRYPKDKEEVTGYSYEPWHLRYVGKDLAKYLKKNNLTLEEYYEKK